MRFQRTWWGIPGIAGVVWAFLWTAVFRVAALMDRLELMRETPATVAGRMVVFHVWLGVFILATVLPPLVVWWLNRPSLSMSQRFLRVGYTLGLFVLVGYGTLVAGSHLTGWARQALEMWSHPDFVARQVLAMGGVLVSLSAIKRQRARRSTA